MKRQMGELEAVLLRTSLENNCARMRFPDAGAGRLIRIDAVDTYLERIARR
jgi:hypothetical protein